MLLTLVRHGKAVDRDKWHQDDSERPLTKDGIEQAVRTFKLVRKWIEAEEVWTSPWTRARQTAELAADAWKLPLREVEWLAGEAMPAEQRVRLLPRGIDVALVGHEPDLGELAGALTGGNPIVMKKAGFAVLEGDPALRAMRLSLLLSPKLALGLADD
jgi:phosphohistidine phosphatase